jgi:hypothetical protein
MRCVYCVKTFECVSRPKKCPHCAATFSLTAGPGTTVAQFVRATAKNEREVTFSLASLSPESDA